jgi:hypothetical protein
MITKGKRVATESPNQDTECACTPPGTVGTASRATLESVIKAFEMGHRSGRRAAVTAIIIGTAATPEDARLALGDLEAYGVAGLDDKGRRVELSRRSGPLVEQVEFDEEPVRSLAPPTLEQLDELKEVLPGPRADYLPD